MSFFLFVYLFLALEVNGLDLCDTQNLYDSNVTEYKYALAETQDCNCTNINTCIRKCCAVGYHLIKTKCVLNNNLEYNVDVVDIFNEEHRLVGNRSFKENLLIGRPQCDFFFPLMKEIEPLYDLFLLEENGRLWTHSYEYFDNNNYCLDDLEGVGRVAMICHKDPPTKIKVKINTTGMMISMPFLLATFIVYALLPDRNLHMKALMSYVLNLFFGYLLLIIIQLSISSLEYVECVVLGYFCLFFNMASFIWMNVICIDIWCTFSGFKGFSGTKNAERKRFLMYCCYAWGLSIIHLLVVFTIDQISPVDSWYKPGIGQDQCFLSPNYGKLLYLYVPLCILTIINVILYTITAFKIKSIKKDTAVLKREDSRCHNYENNKQKYSLYLKLLFAMGVNWSFEIIAFFADWSSETPSDAVLTLTDLCNAAYGVFIFFIFVYKKSIWKSLKKRYYAFIGRPCKASSLVQTPGITKSTTPQSSLRVSE